MAVTPQQAAQARRTALASGKAPASDVPGGVREREAPPQQQPQQLRAAAASLDGKQFLTADGYASVYERGYEMWDFYGPYTEVVSAGAGKTSLAAGPDVVFLINHRGLPLARTSTGTLDLAEDDTGLRSVARMNPKRGEATDLHEAISDGTVTEMSFAFSIDSGTWSPDFSQYRIDAYDIDRGDTSAVTFGANPHTSIEARAQFARTAEFMQFLAELEGPALAAAHERLAQRLGATLGSPKPGPGAVEGLRLLRSAVDAGRLGATERAQIAAVLRRVEDGSLGQVLTGDASLPDLLGVAAAGEGRGGMSVDMVEAILATA